MDHGPMANGDIAADGYGLTWISMQNGPILNIAALANHNGRHISPGDGRGPDTRSGGEVNIADHDGRRRYPRLWVDARGGPGDLLGLAIGIDRPQGPHVVSSFGHEQQMRRASTIVGVRAG
jgi:hypothetical protein